MFSSSCSLYGSAGDDYIDETADFNPVTPYGWSKINTEQEDLLRRFDELEESRNKKKKKGIVERVKDIFN